MEELGKQFGWAAYCYAEGCFDDLSTECDEIGSSFAEPASRFAFTTIRNARAAARRLSTSGNRQSSQKSLNT